MSHEDILLEKDVNALFESKIYDIVTNAMIEHDQAILNTFKELPEKLGISNLTNAYSSGERAGINYCIYILESLIERRRKEKDASERDGEDL